LWDVGQQTCLGVISDLGGEVNCCSVGAATDTVDLQRPDNTPSKLACAIVLNNVDMPKWNY